ncbi:MAG TPA: hypothetical protein P5234_07920 [Thermoanaerobaculaceae bacterium]|nr:hypothetical protein [Thermoanaerobaculaceae bacterium]HRS16165.1 hypothetical protein [Thermoanaerobaculaceae bacterium]
MIAQAVLGAMLLAAVPAEVIVPIPCDESLWAGQRWTREITLVGRLATGETTLLRLGDGVAGIRRGWAMVGERSFAPLPFEPAVFACDPQAPRLAIAAVPSGMRDGLGSRVAVWQEGTWKTRPEPRAKITALFWQGATLHAAVTTCTSRRCSNTTSLSELKDLPKELVVWKALDPGARAWRNVLSLPVPQPWREELGRRYARGKWDFDIGLWQQAIRELTAGFLLPTPSGRFWFVGKGLGPVQLRDATGRLETEVAIPELVPQSRSARQELGSGTVNLPAAAILAAAPLGEDLLVLAWLDGGLGVVQIDARGKATVRLLPEGSTIRYLSVEEGRVHVYRPCGVLPIEPSTGK